MYLYLTLLSIAPTRFSTVKVYLGRSNYQVKEEQKNTNKMDWEKDCKRAVKFALNHELCEEIHLMYFTGPPTGSWHFWQSDSPAFKVMKNFVLDMGYDSSAYAIMQRRIQGAICEEYASRKSSEEEIERKKKVIQQIKGITAMALQLGHMPTEADEIMRMLKGVPTTKAEVIDMARRNQLEWIYAQGMDQTLEEYQLTMNKSLAHHLDPAQNTTATALLDHAYEPMDEENKQAMDVWRKEGPEAAAAHMMKGRTYAEMRMHFG